LKGANASTEPSELGIIAMKKFHLALCTSAFLLAIGAVGHTQPGRQPYPTHLPYRFTNFPWWTDSELKTILQKRIPSLGNEIAVTSEAEKHVRNTLTALLKEKGIAAEVQSIEPSNSSLNPQEPEEHDFWDLQFPPTPRPSVEFSILTPNILVGNVSLLPANNPALSIVQSETTSHEGKPFVLSDEAFMQYRTQKVLRQNGYLAAEVNIHHSAPRPDGGNILVDVTLDVDSGPKFTVSSISADGGPLFENRDLSPLFVVRAGDAAGRDPFQRLEPQLRDWYRRSGYLEVRIETHPQLDREQARVAYLLSVTPGPVYHLRQLSVRNLNAAQEAKVRELLGMKPGDPFNANAVDTLQQKCEKEPVLNSRTVVSEVRKMETQRPLTLPSSLLTDGTNQNQPPTIA
jgi:hypothetical protein